MTERFTLMSDDDLQLYDFIEDNGKVIHTSKVVNILNDLHEENEHLKEQIADWETSFVICKYKKDNLTEENEQLKYTLGAYKVDLNNYKGKCSALEKENEQLKQQEKRLYNYFRKCFNNVSVQEFDETWEMVKKYD